MSPGQTSLGQTSPGQTSPGQPFPGQTSPGSQASRFSLLQGGKCGCRGDPRLLLVRGTKRRPLRTVTGCRWLGLGGRAGAGHSPCPGQGTAGKLAAPGAPRDRGAPGAGPAGAGRGWGGPRGEPAAPSSELPAPPGAPARLGTAWLGTAGLGSARCRPAPSRPGARTGGQPRGRGRCRGRAGPSRAEPLSPHRSAAPGWLRGRRRRPRPGSAWPGPARPGMAARPALPVLAHSVLAAVLLSAAQEPVPRVSLPYGECPPAHGECLPRGAPGTPAGLPPPQAG